MKVIKHIQDHGLESLTEFGISIKRYPEGLIVLNYNQIESPKTHPIVVECRGLIIDEEYNIVSRSFDRFFNYGENNTTFNPSISQVYEKVDGSLIKIYNWKGTWYISTRGTAFAESRVNGFDLTFKDMVWKALGVNTEPEFQNLLLDNLLDTDLTYIFEVTGMENRVVTRYEGYKLWFLNARNNLTGEYTRNSALVSMIFLPLCYPKLFEFSSVESCIETATALPDLQEGYVVYENGVPSCKVKSPAYVAVHFIRGEGLTPRRIAELVVINEQDEYLKYYPEDSVHFNKYIFGMAKLLEDIQLVYDKYRHMESQKEFAIGVKDYKFSFVLFEARKQKQVNAARVFNNFPVEGRAKLLIQTLEDSENA